MTQPLNYTTKAIADLIDLRNQPTFGRRDAVGVDFLISKLRRAEVFVLPDHGQLLDRSKVRPQVPGQLFKPPFPVVALEYQSFQPEWSPTSEFDAAPSSRRIALAWEWDGELPGKSVDRNAPAAGDGVFVASISYFDNLRHWVPTGAALMLAYEAEYQQHPTISGYRAAMVAAGRVAKRQAEAPAMTIKDMLTLLPESMMQVVMSIGKDAAIQAFTSDVMDEANAYSDLCLALSCNNVSASRTAQPERLNRSRIKTGKAPLKDFHVLKIAGHEGDGGPAFGGSDGVRSHLRRGHVRRIAPDRMTWVNACMVRGARAGFVDKQQRWRRAMTAPDRLIRLSEVIEIVGVGKTMIYRLMSEGRFPPQYKPGGYASRWSEVEVRSWVERQRNS